MDIKHPKYGNPGADARARAKRFIYDWMVDLRYVRGGERTIACSRAMLEDALTEEFTNHADAVRRSVSAKAGARTRRLPWPTRAIRRKVQGRGAVEG